MHESSYANMRRLASAYLEGRRPDVVYDIGSLSIGGSYRDIFEDLGWEYLGIDIEDGLNVDIVLDDPYTLPLEDGSARLVISGQAFEHIEFFWLTFKEMARVLAPGGLIFPARGMVWATTAGSTSTSPTRSSSWMRPSTSQPTTTTAPTGSRTAATTTATWT